MAFAKRTLPRGKTGFGGGAAGWIQASHVMRQAIGLTLDAVSAPR
jgi:hypothetical protein